MSADAEARRQVVAEAEMAVLGSILTFPAAIPEALVYLDGESFADPRNEKVFIAATGLHARGTRADIVTVADELARMGHMRGNLDVAYLHAVATQQCLVPEIGHYAAIVAGEKRRRDTATAARRVLDAINGTDREDLPSVARNLITSLEGLTGTVEGAGGPLDKFAFDGWSFLKHQGADVEPVWGRRGMVAWPMGEACMIAGPSGVGKTTIAHQVVLARIGLGGDVLGLPVAPTGSKVLYLAMDRPMQIARAFSRLVRDEHEAVLRDRLVWWGGPLPVVLEKEPWVLAELAERHDADTIVVDSIKDSIRKVSDDECGNAYNRARQNALAEGYQMFELHHNRKGLAGQSREEGIDAVFGSGWLTAGAGSVFGLFGDPGDPVVRMRHLKQSSGDLGTFQVMHDFDRGISQIDDTRDPLAILRRVPGGVTAQELAFMVSTKNDGPDRNEVEKARRKLDGFVGAGVAVVISEEPRGSGGKPVKRYGALSREADPGV